VPLTDSAVRTAKPAVKAYRLFDSGGLYLEVAPSGGKWWRLKYRHGGKEKRLSLGTYPDTGLKDAREKRDEHRKLLAAGVDPGTHRKAAKLAGAERAGNSFEVVAREWFAKQKPNWAENHSIKIIQRLERDVFPWLGARPVAEVTAPELLQVLRRVEARALETAHRALQNCGQVFRYAVATGRAPRDPTPDLRGALAPWKPVHFASITTPVGVGELLRAIETSNAGPVVKSALRLAPLLFVRPGELRQARWEEIDLDAAEWNIPAERMKMRLPHLVPLSKQAVAILRELHPITGGEHRKHVFPGRTDETAMSNNAVRLALRRIGYDKNEMSGHGFRAMARTILDEQLGVRPDFIEHQLAHRVRDPNGRAYNRTAHLDERRKMMQQWADYLDKLREDDPMKRKSGEADKAKQSQRKAA
jgi:integrase